MKVREVMTPNPSCIRPNDNVQLAAQEMKLHNVGVLPVCDEGVLFGIITDRDIAVECVATGNSPIDCLVKDYMTANPITISPEADTDEALELMGREQVRRLCVMENGHLVGIISLGDLAVRALDEVLLARTLARISQPVRSGEPVFR
ncbi:MAG TPA: CBS domain-containing protein [Dehalococcoidia bacterium]